MAHSVLDKRLYGQRRKHEVVALDVIDHVQAISEVLLFQGEVGFGVLHLLFKGDHFIGTAERFKMRTQVHGKVGDAFIYLGIFGTLRAQRHQRIADKMRLDLRHQHFIVRLLCRKPALQ